MAIKSYKPTTAARRQMTVTDYSQLSKVAPEKSLVESLKTNSGRNSYSVESLFVIAVAAIEENTVLSTSREKSWGSRSGPDPGV